MAIRETKPIEPVPEAPAGMALVQVTNEIITPAVFFKPAGSDAVLARLKEEVRRQAAVLDISTPKGRVPKVSIAY